MRLLLTGVFHLWRQCDLYRFSFVHWHRAAAAGREEAVRALEADADEESRRCRRAAGKREELSAEVKALKSALALSESEGKAGPEWEKTHAELRSAKKQMGALSSRAQRAEAEVHLLRKYKAAPGAS